MDVTDQAITEFAEHLVPEAFTTASSASRVEIIPLDGKNPFGTWLERCRREAVTARDPDGAGLGGVVYVQRDDERWRWDLPDAVWPLGLLADRVRNDVVDFPDPLVFVCSLWARERQRLRGASPEALDCLAWTVPWYLEVRRAAAVGVFTGLCDVVGSTIVGDRPLPARTRFERDARNVLLRHPSRRRHRLR